MQILEVNSDIKFPFDWVDLDCYPNSKALRREVYLKTDDDVIHNLMELFYDLFTPIKAYIFMYDELWWQFCLDVWDIHNDVYRYEYDKLSNETQAYLSLLRESKIELDYSGVCKCNDWNAVLPIILDCIIHHIAPHSPILFSKSEDMFFYFHHTGSMGLYYKDNNCYIDNILNVFSEKYDIIIYE